MKSPSFQRLQPGNATVSYLYMKLAADPRILGEPMPAPGSPLSAADRGLVETWINQGAQ